LTHEPCWHASEQQSPNWVHDPPLSLQLAPVPPQTPLVQSLLQQSPFAEHDFPSAEQLGVVQTPLMQLPLQQSLEEPQVSPCVMHEELDGDPLGAMHTPEQARLQQSDHDEQVTPTAVQEPPAPPSISHASSVAGAPAQPMKIATSVPRVSDVVRFMTGPFATRVPLALASISDGKSASYGRRRTISGDPSGPPAGSGDVAFPPKVRTENNRTLRTLEGDTMRAATHDDRDPCAPVAHA
jgi:hypothetical protein